MKITTYNVNGIKARLPRLLEYLAEADADLVCLQELKAPDDAFPELEVRAAGYEAVWHGQKSWNGVAVLSRVGRPVPRQIGLPGEPEDDHSRYLEVEVAGLVLASLYLPNGNPVDTPKFDYKLRWMRRLRERAAQLWAEERPVVLAGDYNVIVEDRDVFDADRVRGDALIRPETRAEWRALMGQGWTEAMRALHPDDVIYTFWDYQAGAWQRNHGFRIDHFLLTPPAADRLEAAGVDKAFRGREKASDHAPTFIRLAD